MFRRIRLVELGTLDSGEYEVLDEGGGRFFSVVAFAQGSGWSVDVESCAGYLVAGGVFVRLVVVVRDGICGAVCFKGWLAFL